MDSIYMRFVDYKSGVLNSSGGYDANIANLQDPFDTKSIQFLKVSSFSSDIEQTLNIGSQSTGAGAGKVTFNPFTIRKAADAFSPVLFQNAASGTPFKTVDVFCLNAANLLTLRYTYKLVAVKTISWSADGDGSGMQETVTFEYGGLILNIGQQGPDGKIAKWTLGGWNRVRNVKDVDLNAVIQ